jgi:hypothetical protein
MRIAVASGKGVEIGQYHATIDTPEVIGVFERGLARSGIPSNAPLLKECVRSPLVEIHPEYAHRFRQMMIQITALLAGTIKVESVL